ncbi:MAG TPA: hydantoinase/oxoprolinase family protein [Gemmatimonadota bacterium]|nr:hydantoinase/oxoprolinase family protein [Gemmatimonadota bacterium]
MGVRIGADTGGTFTDFVLVHPDGVRSWKAPSTPDDFSCAVLEGVSWLLGQTGHVAGTELVHASTVATNALLERRGAKTALVTTRGFKDVLAIGRQARPDLYDLRIVRPDPLVPEPLRLEVEERVSAEGEVLVPLASTEIEAALDRARNSGAESIAVCLLFSFLHPDHERAIGERARARGLACSLSSVIAPEFREYERTSTTVANAFVAPVVERYVRRLSEGASEAGIDRVRIVQSNGGSLDARSAAERAVQTILSGPAAGVLGAREVARRALGAADPIITFDMGGTSTDASLQEGRVLRTTTGTAIGGVPIQIPVVDIHTVGAGGGSIARLDAGGALAVGPESAGADPGPACYGRGEDPTVTDANVVLGRIDPGRFLGGRMTLDPGRAEGALARLAAMMKVPVQEAARSVVRVVNGRMEHAVRVVSVRRGHDPRAFTLVSFGGAGGLHACALAEALGMTRVLVPRDPGVLSAWGAVACDVVRDYSRTVLRRGSGRPGPSDFLAVYDELHRLAEREMMEEGFVQGGVVATRVADLRYVSQSYELSVPFDDDREALAGAFHAAHERRYGHCDPGEPVEIVTLRLRVAGPVERPEPEPVRGTADAAGATLARSGDHRIVDREALRAGARLEGPALLVEPYATTHLAAGWRARVDAWGHLHLER